ncbi:MAG: NAD(P)H-hydrate dehydratase [Burkholderiales bacterium]|nr:NAD(P)H-hydrate dehydratase [Burkholderiales bacterium]
MRAIMTRSLAHDAPVLAAAELRALETAAAGMPLMEMAGLAAAGVARDMAGDSGAPVLVLAGPGNNGGDAFVLARHLRQWWFGVTVVFAGDEKVLAPDAAAALAAWRAAGGTTVDAVPAGRRWALVVDGIFGIGLAREVAGRYADWVAAIHAARAPVLALDVPSGLDSETGRVMGCAVRATATVTFIGLKPGLLTLDGVDHCGDLHVRSLGLDRQAAGAARGRVLGAGILAAALAPRSRNTHKGHYGSAGVIGGDHGMVGAVLLASRAALKLGAGRVYAGLLAGDAPLVDPGQPEVMVRSADAVLKLDHLTALAVGPGLGTLPDAGCYLEWALESSLPVVLDADALNIVSMNPELRECLAARNGPTVITPHPAEAARLLETGTREVQADRVSAARTLAARFKCPVALKGAGTIVAVPDGSWHVNVSGNPGLASAGTGDVLTGFVAALLAQGIAPRTALLAAVFLHGAAADDLLARGIGPVGLTAGELIDAARAIVNRFEPPIGAVQRQ